MTTGDTRAISCPKCGAGYRVKSDASGRLRCKGCGATFTLTPESTGTRRGRRAHDRNDQKTALRLMFVGGALLLIIAVVVVALGKKTTPAPVKRDRPEFNRSQITRRSDPIFSEPEGYKVPEHPKTITLQFLKAVGDGDEETVRRLFMFTEYYQWAAKKYSWDEDDDKRYDRVGPERKRELEEMAVDFLLTPPELMEYVKRYLVPDIENGTAKPVSWDHEKALGYWDYLVQDSKGEKIFNVAVSSRLKAGLDPYTDGLKLENWGVYRMAVKWHVEGIRAKKSDRRAVDQIIGAKRKKARDAAREKRLAASRGPIEADPEHQEPLEGTGVAQMDAVRNAVKVLIDPRSSGPEMYRARTSLQDVGKPAIPFLLNGLLNKDHKENEQDIIHSMSIVNSLKEMTGESFGYGPPTAGAVGVMGGAGLAGATPEQRVRAVRRWFGWWKHNKDTWAGRKPAPDEEEDG